MTKYKNWPGVSLSDRLKSRYSGIGSLVFHWRTVAFKNQALLWTIFGLVFLMAEATAMIAGFLMSGLVAAFIGLMVVPCLFMIFIVVLGAFLDVDSFCDCEKCRDLK